MNTFDKGRGYSCFVFINNCRDTLLKRFVPKYPTIVAHHVTEKFGISGEEAEKDYHACRGLCSSVNIYGYLNSGDGLEVLLVTVDGKKNRPNGRPYHITWSLRSDRYKPVDSNKLIAKKNYQPVVSESIGMIYWWEPFK